MTTPISVTLSGVSLTVSGHSVTGGVYYIGSNSCILNLSDLLNASGIASYSFTQTYTTSGAYVSGASYPMNTTTDGSYDISMSFTDLANNTASSQRITTFVDTVDPTPQTISVSGANFVNNIYYVNLSGGLFSLNVAGLSGGTPMSYYTYTQTGPSPLIFSGAYAYGNTIPLRTVLDGSYNITVTFTDLTLRSVTSNTIQVFVETDNPPPQTISVSGANFFNNIYYVNLSGGLFSLNVAGLSGGAPMSYYTYTQTGPSPLTFVGAYAYGNTIPLRTVSDGLYTISVTFTDLSLRSVTSNTIQVFVETNDPIRPTLSVSGSTYYTATSTYYTNVSGAAFVLNVSGLSGETPMNYYTYVQSGIVSLNFSGAYTFGSTIPLRTTVDGSYSVYVTFTDLALRSTTTLPINVFLASSNTSQPTLSISGANVSDSIYYTNSSGALVNVSGLTTSSAFSTYQYTQTNTVGFTSPNPVLPVPQYTLSTPKPGTYTIYANFKDSQGNVQSIGPITIVRQ